MNLQGGEVLKSVRTHMRRRMHACHMRRSRGLGWRIHGSVEDTKLSTNKQHSLSGLSLDACMSYEEDSLKGGGAGLALL